jgi:hypothetical protein
MSSLVADSRFDSWKWVSELTTQCTESHESAFCVSAEVVLSQIIPAFRFTASKDEVVWRYGGLSTLSMKESVKSFPPKFPSIVSRVYEKRASVEH